MNKVKERNQILRPIQKVRNDLASEWVNPSKRGGMDGVFRRLAGLPQEPCQLEENPAHPDSFTQIYILFPIGFFYFPE